MSAGPLMLVLNLFLADGQQVASYVIDYGLSQEDCDTAIRAAPPPVTYYGTSVLWTCESEEDHD